MAANSDVPGHFFLLLLLLPFLWSACDMSCVPQPSVFTPLADSRPAVDGLENTFSCEYARRSREWILRNFRETPRLFSDHKSLKMP